MKASDPFGLPSAARAYIHELEARTVADAQRIAERDARIDELTRRIETLEEKYRLALAQRFAPKSERRKDRVFNEAEQIAEAEPAEDDGELPELPDTGLPDADSAAPGPRGSKPMAPHLPRERVEDDLPEDQTVCACCGNPLHRIGEEMSEQLHYEVQITVLQNARFKCRGVKAATWWPPCRPWQTADMQDAFVQQPGLAFGRVPAR